MLWSIVRQLTTAITPGQPRVPVSTKNAVVTVAIAGIGPEDDLINRLAKACLKMAFHVQMDARNQEEFYEQVISQLNTNFKGIGEHLRDIMSLVRQRTTELDNIQ
jgi:hypothetical protein